MSNKLRGHADQPDKRPSDAAGGPPHDPMVVMTIRLPKTDIERLRAWLWDNKREKLASGMRRIIIEYMMQNVI